MDTYICDCGHPESPHSDFTRGYGKDENDKTFCYECAAEKDKSYMREHGKTTLYLVRRDGKYFVTNWPASLEIPVYGLRTSWHNFGTKRQDFWFKFEGAEWHGYQIGDFNEIAHCQRTKKHCQ